jgi:hypothetical protein
MTIDLSAAECCDVPSYAAERRKRDWSDDRVYRRASIGANLLARKIWRRSSSGETIPQQPSAKSSAAIYCGSCARFFHNDLFMPM